jgi:hypothetical protein
MATYDDLREQFRQLNKKAQRIQHQTEMMRRRLPIARTALETVASGDHVPEILRIAREALKELNVSSVPVYRLKNSACSWSRTIRRHPSMLLT